MSRAAIFLAFASLVRGDQKSLDCPLRQIGLDYAAKVQPFRAPSVFQEFADALNGAVEAQVRPILASVTPMLFSPKLCVRAPYALAVACYQN